MSRYTPLWLQQGSYAASVDRRLVAAIWPTPASSGAAATVSGGTMSVSVAAGSCAVPTQNGTGSTLCVWDAPELVTHSAAPGSPNSRIDIITVHPRGNDLDSGSNNDFIIDIVAGTPATSPAAPAVPAGQVGIWQVMVPTGAAALVQGNLTDIRPGGLGIPPSGAGSPPRGWVASGQGPASVVTAAGTFYSLAVPLVAGRRYRVSAYALASATGAWTGYLGVSDTGTYVPVQRVISVNAAANGQFLAGAFVGVFAATATATDTFNLNVTGSNFSVGVNWAWLSVEDIGST